MQDYHDYIIYKCIVGSQAYGLDTEDSDIDYRGIYLPPAELHWSIDGVPDQLERKDPDEVYWELSKFVRLALKANPNILECLYTKKIVSKTEIAQELLDINYAFLSQKIYNTYRGYARSQYLKIKKQKNTGKEVSWKHAMHLIRLLLAGVSAARDGYIMVYAGEFREDLLRVRNGEYSFDDLVEWMDDLEDEFDREFNKTHLPEYPDCNKVNKFLIKARRSMV